MRPVDGSEINLISSKPLIGIYKNYFIESCEHGKNQSTMDWLQNMGQDATFQKVNENTLEINIQNSTYRFSMEERLENFISMYGCFNGLYQYCLGCSVQEYSIILKRTNIADCFIRSYNATLLKAFRNKIEIVPLCSELSWWNFDEKYLPRLPNLEDTIISDLAIDHALISIPEFYALSDAKKIPDILSAPMAFIATHENIKPKFRKVHTRTENTYVFPGGGFYQILSSNVQRHNQRMNADSILLVESGIWYDALSSSDGIEIYNLYKDKLDKIPNGEIVGVSGNFFPTYILCENMQVMKLRKKRKVLQTPNFTTLSDEYKYMKVILFYPLKPKAVVEIDRIGK